MEVVKVVNGVLIFSFVWLLIVLVGRRWVVVYLKVWYREVVFFIVIVFLGKLKLN